LADPLELAAGAREVLLIVVGLAEPVLGVVGVVGLAVAGDEPAQAGDGLVVAAGAEGGDQALVLGDDAGLGAAGGGAGRRRQRRRRLAGLGEGAAAAAGDLADLGDSRAADPEIIALAGELDDRRRRGPLPRS